VSNNPKIADDYEYIAQRMREIEDEKEVMKYRNSCERCDDYGWIMRSGRNSWSICPQCRNRWDRPAP
jgi:ribosomal protein L37AE/L43A